MRISSALARHQAQDRDLDFQIGQLVGANRFERGSRCAAVGVFADRVDERPSPSATDAAARLSVRAPQRHEHTERA
jgi:hypothetical protein